MALLSWWTTMHPALPLLKSPPSYASHPTKADFSFGHSHPMIGTKADLDSSASKARKTLAEHHDVAVQPNDGQTMGKKSEVFDKGNDDEAERTDDQFDSESAINKHLSKFINSLMYFGHSLWDWEDTGSKIDATDNDPPPNAAAFKPVILLTEHDPVPMAMANRPPRGCKCIRYP